MPPGRAAALAARSLLGALIGAAVPDDPWRPVAAWLAEHTGAELAERARLLGIAAGPVAGRVGHLPWPIEETPAARPVRDLLVVDFSALWAGPLCAHLLGLAGARVVKVETPGRPDGARRGHPGFFDLLHSGHRSVVLDPGTRDGRAALRALIDAADIVIEASRPRALARWGLDAQAAVQSGTVWISITAFGRESERIGFGDDVASSGLVARDDDGSPMFVGDAIADPLTGLAAAVRALDPAPRLWDVAMGRLVASTLPPTSAAPSPAAVRDGDRWMVDTKHGRLPVAAPRPRRPAGRAPRSGIIPELTRRGLRVVTQPGFLSDRGDDYLRDVHEEDHADLYRCASLLDAGVPLALSSDAPYGPADPWQVMQAAVHRSTASGAALSPVERLTPRAALDACLGAPDAPGGRPRRVRPGMRGDLVLLRVPLAEALRTLDTRLVATVLLDGEPTHLDW
ncbi:CoA transferase [Actinomadura viridis]|uniref:CoA transferase n=1 Tax=Actinomadura viridis TaxID=58110 RepID=UPI0036A00D18